jgi:hypothetical protein
MVFPRLVSQGFFDRFFFLETHGFSSGRLGRFDRFGNQSSWSIQWLLIDWAPVLPETVRQGVVALVGRDIGTAWS